MLFTLWRLYGGVYVNAPVQLKTIPGEPPGPCMSKPAPISSVLHHNFTVVRSESQGKRQISRYLQLATDHMKQTPQMTLKCAVWRLSDLGLSSGSRTCAVYRSLSRQICEDKITPSAGCISLIIVTLSRDFVHDAALFTSRQIAHSFRLAPSWYGSQVSQSAIWLMGRVTKKNRWLVTRRDPYQLSTSSQRDEMKGRT